jgi:hypothetical protein
MQQHFHNLMHSDQENENARKQLKALLKELLSTGCQL